MRYSSDLNDLIRVLLQVDPLKRPSCCKIFLIKNDLNEDKFIGYTKKDEPLDKKLKRYLTGSKYCNNQLYNNSTRVFLSFFIAFILSRN